jgi:hypothetical protein
VASRREPVGLNLGEISAKRDRKANGRSALERGSRVVVPAAGLDGLDVRVERVFRR